ncbi:histidine kinase [Paenibacillus alkaliterrae]|uniref:sensor histidine kinase n=1 Tax=Paenibacillus alkaliterrae TaxID=320909 RepID=UPI001F42C250|nr:sensor histidine kinase [Paenibacillus alkaliterrae]MCF2938039.1 histidine kinase [Paenibacillus alkaliterrae]
MKFNFFRELSLRQRLIATSIACLMVPTLVMLYNTSSFSQQIIREQALNSASQSLRIVQYQIHGIIEEMVEVSNRVQFNDELKSLLQLPDDPLVTLSVTAQLEQMASARPDIRLTLLMRDGRYYSNYSFYEFDPSSFRQQPWFQKLSGLSPFDTLYLGVQPNYLTIQAEKDPFVIMTARSLTDYSSAPFAYLIVSRTENTVSGIIDNLSEDIFLLDQNQRILSHRDEDYIGQDFGSLMSTSTDVSPGIIHLAGENQIYVSMPVQYAEWSLVSLVPYEQLTDKVNRIYRSGLLLQILFAAGFLLFLAYLLRKFTKPIKILGDIALKVESGDLQIRSNVRSGDEVGRLGRSFDHMLDRISEMLEQVKLEQELKRQAELAMLQVQINPHFLFNVLSSIRLKLLMKGDDENAELVGSLSSLLRTTLSSQQEFVPLLTEIDITRQYMDLMNFSLRHQIESTVETNADLHLETVPRFILQPIIENCYKHGFSRRGGRISIRVEKTEETLRITIEDNGVGMNAQTLSRVNDTLKLSKRQIMERRDQIDGFAAGIGLTNVYNRLKLIYGDQFQMNMDSEYQKGTTVVFIFPTSITEGNQHV